MRKTGLFIFIAVLLFTLIMSVACDSTPVSVPENLVKASISLTDSRSLIKEGADSLADIDYFKYKLTPLWNYGTNNYSEEIYGKMNDYALLSDDGVLGWVTPGKWNVSIKGYNSNHVEIYIGDCVSYFGPNNDKATVYMAPINGNSKISISIDQPMLSSNQYEYNYIYRLIDAAGNVATYANDDTKRIEGVISFFSINGATGTYKTEINNIKSGKYSLAIYCYRNDSNATSQMIDISEIINGELIGGEVKMVSLPVNYEEKITGTLDFSDFVNGDVHISLLSIVAEISHTALYKLGEYEFTLNDTTLNEEDKVNYNISYEWYVNGIKKGENTTTFNHSFTTYGPKEVACVVTYQSIENTKKVYTSTIKDSFTIKP